MEDKRYPREDVEAKGLSEEVQRHLRELDGEGKDKGLEGRGIEQRGPEPDPILILPAENSSLPSDIPHSPTPPPPASQPSLPQSLMSKAQILALNQLNAILSDSERLKDLSPNQLIGIIAQLEDMKLTAKWTKKLESIILAKPSKLQPPNAKGQMLQKLKGYATKAKGEGRVDMRESVNKLFDELPSDE